MGTVTYYVALAFMKSDDSGEIVACDSREARSSEYAIRLATSLAKAERALRSHRVFADSRPGASAPSTMGKS
jgi:hypothetical protein